MNYSAIKTNDIANGTGVRVSLFVSGCPHHCKGCFNESTWDYHAGYYFGDDQYKLILSELGKDHVSGLSLLGGEPLASRNWPEVKRFALLAKTLYPEKETWLYTGFSAEFVLHNRPELLSVVDVLVTDPFVEELKDISLKFRGSSNQRIWRVNHEERRLDPYPI